MFSSAGEREDWGHGRGHRPYLSLWVLIIVCSVGTAGSLLPAALAGRHDLGARLRLSTLGWGLPLTRLPPILCRYKTALEGAATLGDLPGDWCMPVWLGSVTACLY